MIKDFHKRVLNNKFQRNRLAIIGDARLKHLVIDTIAKTYPGADAHAIHVAASFLQENKFFIAYMMLNGIQIPSNLIGKEVADYFEAWIGYLHEKQPETATRFCISYTKSLLHIVSECDIAEWTKKLIAKPQSASAVSMLRPISIDTD